MNTNLTRLQFLYWIAQNLRSDSPLFNSILLMRIQGAVDEEVFQKAHDEIFARSDALRTVIIEVDGVPLRKVHAGEGGFLELLDFSSEDDPQRALSDFLQKRTCIPFRLEEGLFDSVLIRLAPDQYAWYFNQHHINTDASAAFLVVKTVFRTYSLALENRQEELKLRAFEDYYRQEKEFEQSPAAKKFANYWEAFREIQVERLHFFGRPIVKRSTEVERRRLSVGAERSAQIRDLARQANVFLATEEVSNSIIFIALLSVFLHNLSANTKIGFVTPVHNRLSVENRETIGLLMELCPFVIEMAPGQTFQDVIRKVRDATLKTLMNYRFGSQTAIENNAFDVMFNVNHIPNLTLHGLPVTVERIHQGHGGESLAFHVNEMEASGDFLLFFDLHKDVFRPQEREKITGDFLELLDACLESPGSPIIRKTYQNWSSTGSDGKPDRNGAYQAPSDALEKSLVSIWESVLGIDKVGVRDDFYAAGGSSWLATRLFLRIQTEMGRNLPLSSLLQAKTIEGMAHLMRLQGDDEIRRKLSLLKKGDRSPPFFCVPGAAGNTLAVGRLAEELRSSHPFYAFEMPGLDEGQNHLSSIEECAAYFLAAMREVQPEGPYMLGGYSWGGLVALEMAQQLRAAGEKIALLAIIDVAVQSPRYRLLRQLTDKMGDWFDWDGERRDAAYLALRDPIFQALYSLQVFSEHARKLEFGRLLWKWRRARFERSRSHGESIGSGDFWDRFDLDENRLKIVRLNDLAVRKYVPHRYPGKVHLYRSSQMYINPSLRSAEHTLGWQRITDQLEVVQIPGNHLEILNAPNVAELGASLDQAIAESANDNAVLVEKRLVEDRFG